jgi:serine/threonine protein kinase
MSTKDYGCFFCEGKSTEENGVCDKCGRQINVGEELKKNQFDDYKPIGILGRGYLGWTLHAISTVGIEGNEFTIKIIPKHRFSDDITKLTKEAEAFIKCTKEYHRHIAKFFHLFETNIEVLGLKIQVIVLVFDYIPKAKPLRKLLTSSEYLSRADVLSLLSGIASGLSRMHSCGLWHDDLHDDNILVREVQYDENLNDKYEIKLIDFGSAKPKKLNEPEPQKGSDYEYFSEHIYGIVAHYEKSQFEKNQLSIADRMFAKRMRILASRISEHNVSRRDITPSNIIDELRRISSEAVLEKDIDTFENMLKIKSVTIKDPLENSNALFLHEKDISSLFIDKLSWEQQLNKSETVILTGPRGCGKTMLLRYLAIINQARPRGDENKTQVVNRLNTLQHISFFVSCPDIKTPFVRSAFEKLEKAEPAKAGDFSREYININFAIEISRTLLWLQQEQLASIDINHLEPLSLFLAQQIKRSPLTSNDSKLQIVLEDYQRHSINLSNLLDYKQYTPTNLCRDDFLIQIATIISSMPLSNGKQIWFLLDDYSLGILPLSVQKAYNSVVFKTSIAVSSMRIRLSSEGDGPITIDQLERHCKEGREFYKVNLGETYFNVGDREAQEFIEN